MSLKALLDAGQLGRATDFQIDQVRRKPTDPEARLVLVDLLCFGAQWDRALKHLDLIDDQAGRELGTLTAAKLRRGLIAGARDRAAVFRGESAPRFALQPTPQASAHVEALGLLAKGEAETARVAIERAAESAPRLAGRRNDRPFAGLANTDDLLAPVLEVLTVGGYSWLPWEHLQYLEVPAPRSLLDLLWVPAKFALHDGQMGEVFLPTIGFGSEAHANEAVRLGHQTEWVEAGGQLVRTLGRAVLVVGEEEPTLLELGTLELPPPGSEAP